MDNKYAITAKITWIVRGDSLETALIKAESMLPANAVVLDLHGWPVGKSAEEGT